MEESPEAVQADWVEMEESPEAAQAGWAEMEESPETVQADWAEMEESPEAAQVRWVETEESHFAAEGWYSVPGCPGMKRLSLRWRREKGFLSFSWDHSPKMILPRHVEISAWASSMPAGRAPGGLSPAQAAGEKENQQDKQDESKPTSAHHRSAQVKSAAAEQEHQYD
jgi:hypothetical protein